MKENEIRLGNWVKAPKGARHNNQEIKWSLSNFYWIEECVDDIEDFQPIPLTEEWLLRFGFECVSDYANKKVFVFKIDLSSSFSVNSEDSELSYFRLNGRYISVKHVHQLQNLYFALTGEELKLKDDDSK